MQSHKMFQIEKKDRKLGEQAIGDGGSEDLKAGNLKERNDEESR